MDLIIKSESESSTDDECFNNDDILVDDTFYDDDVKYKIFDSKQINNELHAIINIVCERTNLERIDACMLLIQNNWDIDRVFEVFYENKFNFNDATDLVNTERQSAICSICLLDVGLTELIELSCQHSICKDCCRRYININVKDKETFDTITCPEIKCNVETKLQFLSKFLLKNGNLYDNMEYIQCNYIMTNNKIIKTCPNCKIPVKIMEGFKNKQQRINCFCGYVFCFKCLEPWHEILSCELIRNFKELGFIAKALENLKLFSINDNNAFEIYEWLRNNIKICPNCSEINKKLNRSVKTKCLKCNYTLFHQREQEINEIIALNLQMDSFIKLMIKTQFQNDSAYKKCAFNCLFHETRIKNEKDKFASISNNQKLYFSMLILRKCRHLLMYTYIFSYFTIETDYHKLINDFQLDLENIIKELVFNIDTLNEEFLTINKYESTSETIISFFKKGYETGIWKFKFDITAIES